MKKSIANMLYCLSHHPEVKEALNKGCVSVFLGYDTEHSFLAEAITAASGDSFFTVRSENIETRPAEAVIELMERCDIFVLFYASSTKAGLKGPVPDFIPYLKPTMTRRWKKSVLFKDYGKYFAEVFSEHPDVIEKRNNRLISILSHDTQITFRDAWGNTLSGYQEKNHKWTSVAGKGNIDIVPGEIASHVKNLNGNVVLGGTFLSTIPFATKYGVAENIVKLKIQDGRVTDFESDNARFRHDFSLYLDINEGNRIIEEFGIGTNTGVRHLYGRNAGFEERHPGLHLGLGGGRKGSHHLDMIFASGQLFAGNVQFFDNGYDDHQLEVLSLSGGASG